MSVAYVAYQKLAPAQKARVAALIALNPNYKKWLGYIPAGTSADDQALDLFMLAATWPDEIKAQGSPYKQDGDVPPKTAEATMNTGYGDMYRHQYWHFIDLPFTMDGTSPLPAVPAPNAQTELELFRKALADPAVSDPLKSYDLVWLIHLAGDLHQPLHCATRVSAAKKRGDGGGNSVPLTNDSLELHAYWDGQLGPGGGVAQNIKVARKAAAALPEADAKAAADLEDADWVQESFALAKSDVYVEPPIGPGIVKDTIAADSAYAKNAFTIAQQRAALAGARLANILNAELK
jgi:hypothetical protein